ncbi:hypothetical protein T11_4519 [Trichinella zimbabwensis]|uniref:Uncharacterized protein n=1 Tax=Trichinella zimbabwensis TaxID=268475 RepID=A0A0V1I8X6_9BILA|nr:hypothetical protein T11_4519 [Trichinella zimbabwensis]
MEPNCKCMKSVMDFFLKSESNVETEKNATADLGNESPQQPVRLKFPVTKFAGSDRSFCAGWYKTFKWLEYSLERDAVSFSPC